MAKKVETLALQLAKSESKLAAINDEIIKATAKQQLTLNKQSEQNQLIREAIKVAMEENGVTKFENDEISITYVKPSERVGVDLNKLKVFHPELAEKYKKITNVKSSIRIKVKDA